MTSSEGDKSVAKLNISFKEKYCVLKNSGGGEASEVVSKRGGTNSEDEDADADEGNDKDEDADADEGNKGSTNSSSFIA